MIQEISFVIGSVPVIKEIIYYFKKNKIKSYILNILKEHNGYFVTENLIQNVIYEKYNLNF